MIQTIFSYQILRQTQQEQDDELRHELDEELDSLRSLLYAPDASSSKTDDSEAALESAVMKVDEKDQEYDQFVRELVFEKRAKPKDRTKTEDELALEEKEALEKAERKRIRRMNGEDWDSDDEAGPGGKAKGKRAERGGDDLEDDFMEEDTYDGGLGAGLGDVDVRQVGSGTDEDESEEDEEDDSEGEDEEEDEDEDEPGGMELMVSEEEDDEDGDDGEHEELGKPDVKVSKRKTTSTPTELPFTFPCPTTHDEFLDIVADVKDSDVPTVVKRIRTLHHPSLAEDNKFKLQVCNYSSHAK